MDEWDWNAVGTHVNFYKGERVLSVTEAAEELNTLERELAAANDKSEEMFSMLHELQRTKTIKDTEGKTSEYMKRRADIWDRVNFYLAQDSWKSKD